MSWLQLLGNIQAIAFRGIEMSAFPIEAVQQARILVIGDIMLDRYWFGEVDRISPEAPVPVVRVAQREDRLGGAANVARNISALGAEVGLLGVIGVDEPAQQVFKLVEQANISEYLTQDTHGMPTTLKMRVLGRQQQLLRVDFEHKPGADALSDLRNNLSKLINEYDLVVLSDYAKGALAEVKELIAIAKKNNKPVLVDPKGHDYSKYHGASLVTPNRSEMRDAVGLWESEQALTMRAQQLRRQLDLQALLITRSEQGMTLYTEAGSQHIDANAQEVFDVSGAGDTVLATLAVSKAAGLSWYDAMYWANKAGGLVVEKLGTSIVTAQELSL